MVVQDYDTGRTAPSHHTVVVPGGRAPSGPPPAVVPMEDPHRVRTTSRPGTAAPSGIEGHPPAPITINIPPQGVQGVQGVTGPPAIGYPPPVPEGHGPIIRIPTRSRSRSYSPTYRGRSRSRSSSYDRHPPVILPDPHPVSYGTPVTPAPVTNVIHPSESRRTRSRSSPREPQIVQVPGPTYVPTYRDSERRPAVLRRRTRSPSRRSYYSRSRSRSPPPIVIGEHGAPYGRHYGPGYGAPYGPGYGAPYDHDYGGHFDPDHDRGRPWFGSGRPWFGGRSRRRRPRSYSPYSSDSRDYDRGRRRTHRRHPRTRSWSPSIRSRSPDPSRRAHTYGPTHSRYSRYSPDGGVPVSHRPPPRTQPYEHDAGIHPSRPRSRSPEYIPTRRPTTHRSRSPEYLLTHRPTTHRSRSPEYIPTHRPTTHRSRSPEYIPTRRPTTHRSRSPEYIPTRLPTTHRSRSPEYIPTRRPTTHRSRSPEYIPTRRPTTHRSPSPDYPPGPSRRPTYTHTPRSPTPDYPPSGRRSPPTIVHIEGHGGSEPPEPHFVRIPSRPIAQRPVPSVIHEDDERGSPRRRLAEHIRRTPGTEPIFPEEDEVRGAEDGARPPPGRVATVPAAIQPFLL
ncbi:hypothetical protein PILCRDRAFT_119048 [Piloderma croceum F 1598]|uniref:Uncharacterized protein n=1 Tax=Piloderma croceum (strain F 1598) TaxID=765440 RepID=A0A0C3GP40_PILCF|nr:hypothetical protein PILCRDRAFT_119048 [Piloderma croceum F 1598]